MPKILPTDHWVPAITEAIRDNDTVEEEEEAVILAATVRSSSKNKLSPGLSEWLQENRSLPSSENNKRVSVRYETLAAARRHADGVKELFHIRCTRGDGTVSLIEPLIPVTHVTVTRQELLDLVRREDVSFVTGVAWLSFC